MIMRMDQITSALAFSDARTRCWVLDVIELAQRETATATKTTVQIMAGGFGQRYPYCTF